MSEYMNFYIRGGDNFYPIGTYCRSSVIYEMFNSAGYNDWEKIRPITEKGLKRVFDATKYNIENWERAIESHKKKIELIRTLPDYSLDEKLKKIEEYQEDNEEVEETIDALETCQRFAGFIRTIIEDGESTKYYDDIDTIDPNHYVYVGIEIGNPKVGDIVGE